MFFLAPDMDVQKKRCGVRRTQMNDDTVPDTGKTIGLKYGKTPSQSWCKRLLKTFVLATVSLHADVETVNGIEWNYYSTGEEAVIFAGQRKSAIPSSTIGDITVPETLGGHPVAEIDSYAFFSCDSLTSVTIPEGVKTIGDSAFYHCSSLTNISIPDSLTEIKEDAFQMCNPMLYDTNTISNIKLIDGWVVGFLSPRIADVKLHNIRGMAYGACADYNDLETLEISGNFKCIGRNAFSNCKSLRNIVIDAPIEIIDDSAFFRCTELLHIELPSTVKEIRNCAFQQCFALTNIVIPAAVTNIGEEAFYGCNSIKTFEIPKNLRSIGEGAFSSCESLEEFIVSSTHKYFEVYRGVLFTKGCLDLVVCPATLEEAVIPTSTTNIMGYAFYDCVNLKYVKMGDRVREIGFAAFHGCDSLAYISLSKKLKYINALGFGYCRSLAEVDIPSENADMYMSAFIGCSSIERVYLVDTYTGPTTVFPSTAKIIRYTTDIAAAAEDVTAISGQTFQMSLEGAADARINENITTEKTYAYFLSWVEKKSKSSFETVMAYPHAWLSYALDYDGLMTVAPRTEDVNITSFDDIPDSYWWDLTANVKGFPIGASAISDNLKSAFIVEGTSTLDTNAFSVTNVTASFDAPIDGKLKLKILPKSSHSERFFFRIRVK